MLTAMSTLYDQIGGAAAVDAAVDRFYQKVLADDRIASFFVPVDMARQAQAQKAFLTSLLKGEARDPAGHMRKAHAHLVREAGLTDRHFDAVAEDLQATLEDLSVPADLTAQIMTAVASLRDAVLDRDGPAKGAA